MVQVVVKRKDDELCHYKYVRREYDLNKGHYRYYYDDIKRPKEKGLGAELSSRLKDKLGYDEQKVYNTAKNTHKLHKDMADFYDEKAKEIAADKDGWRGKEKSQKGMVQIAKENAAYERKNLTEAKKLLTKATSEYKKTPLYKLEQAKKQINKGKKWVKSFFS